MLCLSMWVGGWGFCVVLFCYSLTKRQSELNFILIFVSGGGGREHYLGWSGRLEKRMFGKSEREK